MRGWMVGCLVAPLTLCVVCVSLGYFVALPWARTSVSKQMANAVATSVAGSIDAGAAASGKVVIAEDDLNVNNEHSSGECGANVSTSGTTIHGVVTRITPAGITLACAWAPEVAYTAVPVVEAGRVELTDIKPSSGTLGFIFTERNVEQGLERGINRALEAKDLKPIALTLRDGSMTILVDRDSRSVARYHARNSWPTFRR
jgi:hypothetical protein